MEMQQIRYFLAVADKLNFTRAAEQCNVTQPSLTRAIKLLEEELGGLLVYRERANTRLTELGRMVHSHLEQIYNQSQETRRLAKEITKPKKIQIKLGIMCTIAPDQIIELIGLIRAKHPEVESLRVAFPAACGAHRSRQRDRRLAHHGPEIGSPLQYPAPWGGGPLFMASAAMAIGRMGGPLVRGAPPGQPQSHG